MLSERILIVDDCEPACRSWKRLLDARGSTVAAVHNLTDARAALKAERFDVVLLDLHLEHEWGLRLLDTTDEMWPRPAVVITSAYIDDKVAVQCMGRCVAAIPKPLTSDTLLTCLDKLRKPSTRSTPLAPCVTKLSRSADTISDELAQGCQRYRFSPREIEVIHAGAEGLSVKETAARMRCTSSTVTGYRGRIFGKTECHSLVAVLALLRKKPGTAD